MLYFYIQATIDEEVLRMSTDEIISRTRLLENDIKVRCLPPAEPAGGTEYEYELGKSMCLVEPIPLHGERKVKGLGLGSLTSQTLSVPQC